MDRRLFLAQGALAGGVVAVPAARVWAQAAAPATITREGMRPQMPHGIQSGDPKADGAVIWTRSDRPARLWLDWSTTASFANATRVRGPHMLEDTDFTGRVDLSGLPAGQEIFYRVVLQDLRNERVLSDAVQGHLRLPPAAMGGRASRDVRFVWSGDTAGQGWGINEAWGGMKIYEQMRQTNPDFFLHSGDTIYADGPISAEVKLADGSVWNNLVTEEVSKVAETLNEYRGRYRYNLMDANVRRMAADVPQIWQWDDHEVVNNYSDSKDLSGDDRYTEKNVPLLVARATKAFHEYAPIRRTADVESERVYRHLPQGPLLDLFVVDMRSYRGPNTDNLQTAESDTTTFMGRPQLAWLLDGLKRSKAVWKVIAADMPIGLHVPDGKKWEAIANGEDGAAKGRELEIAGLLRAIKQAGIQNVVWLTADVHYTAAHFYDPAKAQFSDFAPFWEFVSGPLNAGGFGPNKVDGTFGLQVMYQKAPEAPNAPPSSGMQFFGQVDIDARTRAMTVTLKDIAGASLYSKTLAPQRT
ncbi:alkaline phosphatase [Hydrogenophaga crassostreae]|uniref:Alkaline phosphatase n=1 Tax=Hydrogenophaga crassostreae TaxID=1763535 RepID=A0A167H5Q0_9BURK|nr:alkaline phosphatase D family protein [Hydrogenophaga crassostreae]AOW12479.1 alkaline phosphatase [Hydrogenophaga crassostreae]OAD40343.1 alkaline phosphatase [Hydrogenophaga crassostreae]